MIVFKILCIIVSVYVGLLAFEKLVGVFLWLKGIIIPQGENEGLTGPENRPKPHTEIKGFKNENN